MHLLLFLLTATALGCAQGEGHISTQADSGPAGPGGQSGQGAADGLDSGAGDAGTGGAPDASGGGAGTAGTTGQAGMDGGSPEAPAVIDPTSNAARDGGAGAGADASAPRDTAAELAEPRASKVYEAESGRTSGNTNRITCASCSGGKRVSLGADSTVTLSDIETPGPGTHMLAVRYTNGSTQERSIYVGVNGNASQAFWWTFEPTGGWDKVGTIALTLNGWRAGSNNTVTFFIDTELDPPDLDSIELLADQNVAGTDYCQRAHWEATASVTAGDGNGPGGAIDGDLHTRWGSNRDQDGSDWYQVDFGGIVKLSSITLDNSQTSPNDYPGSYAVYGSVDGLSFDSYPFKTGDGAANRTVITFKERSVKAIRIQQTGSSRRGHWWQIGELTVGCRM